MGIEGVPLRLWDLLRDVKELGRQKKGADVHGERLILWGNPQTCLRGIICGETAEAC